MMLVRIILLPFAFLYSIAIAVRNLLYSTGFLSRTRFDVPIICVGNLSAGGTGKTPHISYIIDLLVPSYRVSLLSRGYGRTTTGYIAAHAHTTASDIGDEPLMLYAKHHVPTAVCENRVIGVPNLLADFPDTNCILMDDGFQHLAIQPGFSLLLTDYNHLFTRDWLLPAGRLREFRSGYKRADIIIVSKCPPNISGEERSKIISEINPLPHQLVLFSWLSYLQFTDMNGKPVPHCGSIVLVTGIANASPLVHYLSEKHTIITHYAYSDHKTFTEQHVNEWLKFIASHAATKIVCTQKDAVKLKPYQEILAPHLLIAPVCVQMTNEDKQTLHNTLIDFVNKTLATQNN